MVASKLDPVRSFRATYHLDEAGRATAKPKQTRARRPTGNWVGVVEPTDTPPTYQRHS